MEEHILPVRAQNEAEALPGIVPLHLGLGRPGATLVIAVREHVS
jgi:hypothetical protein